MRIKLDEKGRILFIHLLIQTKFSVNTVLVLIKQNFFLDRVSA